ncbi:MAG: hypothetical protein AB1414_03110 [bacterium]
MEKAIDSKEEKVLSEELRKIFEPEKEEENNLICWGYRDYWPRYF